jgi:hypothetical protein
MLGMVGLLASALCPNESFGVYAAAWSWILIRKSACTSAPGHEALSLSCAPGRHVRATSASHTAPLTCACVACGAVRLPNAVSARCFVRCSGNDAGGARASVWNDTANKCWRSRALQGGGNSRSSTAPRSGFPQA